MAVHECQAADHSKAHKPEATHCNTIAINLYNVQVIDLNMTGMYKSPTVRWSCSWPVNHPLFGLDIGKTDVDIFSLVL